MAPRICHWGPIGALSIILWVTLATVYCNSMYWPPAKSWGGFANMMGFMFLSSLTSFHYIAAMLEGPGGLPKGWRPEKKEDEAKLQFCETCQGFKAPRAHHCRKCNMCVTKMDHHCPWINNCVGHRNHGHFIAFLAFAVIGSAISSYYLAVALYYGLNRSWYHYYGTGSEPVIQLTLPTLFIILFALGLAIGVVLAVGALLFFQLRSVWRNQTGIEDWILEKASYRLKNSEKKFENPYDLGRYRNLRSVLRPGCVSRGDGIEWQLRPGAGKYDMTMEQLEQKKLKRNRTREYVINEDFSGSWCPIWSQGWRVGCKPPCTDEPRIQLSKGDTVNVTRWKKHWLYGDKTLPVATKTAAGASKDKKGPTVVEKPKERVRGWFPRRCAVELLDNTGECETHRQQRTSQTQKKND